MPRAHPGGTTTRTRTKATASRRCRGAGPCPTFSGPIPGRPRLFSELVRPPGLRFPTLSPRFPGHDRARGCRGRARPGSRRRATPKGGATAPFKYDHPPGGPARTTGERYRGQRPARRSRGTRSLGPAFKSSAEWRRGCPEKMASSQGTGASAWSFGPLSPQGRQAVARRREPQAWELPNPEPKRERG